MRACADASACACASLSLFLDDFTWGHRAGAESWICEAGAADTREETELPMFDLPGLKKEITRQVRRIVQVTQFVKKSNNENDLHTTFR